MSETNAVETAVAKTDAGASSPSSIANRKLGARLVQAGVITEEKLQEVRRNAPNVPLVSALVRADSVREKDITDALVAMTGLPHISLVEHSVNEQALEKLGADFCARKQILPLDQVAEFLIVGMVDPLDRETLDEVSRLTSLAPRAVICSHGELHEAIRALGGEEGDGQAQTPEAMPSLGAVAQMMSALLKGARKLDRPVAIVGPGNLAKTHLLCEFGDALRAAGAPVAHVDCLRLALTPENEAGQPEGLETACLAAEVLIFDHLESLPLKGRSTESVLKIVTLGMEGSKAMIAASRWPPAEIFGKVPLVEQLFSSWQVEHVSSGDVAECMGLLAASHGLTASVSASLVLRAISQLETRLRDTQRQLRAIALRAAEMERDGRGQTPRENNGGG